MISRDNDQKRQKKSKSVPLCDRLMKFPGIELDSE